MSDSDLARFVARRTTYRHQAALREVTEAMPSILKVKEQHGWSREQVVRRLIVDRWAVELTARRVRQFTCDNCLAPDFVGLDKKGGGYEGELCRDCRPLTGWEVRDAYDAAAEANFHLVAKSTRLERDVQTVIDEAMQLPERPDLEPPFQWGARAERERYWSRRGLAVPRARSPYAMKEILREAGAPRAVIHEVVGRGVLSFYLDHHITIRNGERPYRRGVVGASYFDAGRNLNQMSALRSAVRIAETHGLLVVMGAYSAYYPKYAIRLEVLGPALAAQLYPRQRVRR